MEMGKLRHGETKGLAQSQDMICGGAGAISGSGTFTPRLFLLVTLTMLGATLQWPRHWTGPRGIWALFPALLSVPYVTLGKSFCFYEPQFPTCKMGTILFPLFCLVRECKCSEVGTICVCSRCLDIGMCPCVRTS